MNKVQLIKNYFSEQLIQTYFNTQTLNKTFLSFVVDIILTILLSMLLAKIYIRFGKSMSNRRKFASNFALLALTTMMIITIIQSSLALSLGLVGALSIIRFRSAIKDPEELVYIFLTISLGLGFGASQRYVTLLFFAAIALLIVIKGKLGKKDEGQNLYLNITAKKTNEVSLDQMIEVLKANCSLVKLKRFDEAADTLDALFIIELDNFDKLNQTRSDLKKLNSKLRINFLDDEGAF